MKSAVLAAIGFGVLSVGAPAIAATAYTSFVEVPGSVSYDGWEQLNRTGMGGGDQTTATNAFVSGFGSNAVESGDGVMTRVSGGVYPAGFGLYGNGVITFTDTTVSDEIEALEFQGIINNFEASPFGLTLSYNGGSQGLIPSLVSYTDTGLVDDNYRYSWDLASIGETIDSYTVTLTLGFTQSLAFQIDQVAAVPEPNTVALGLGGIAIVCATLRRRRAL